MLFVRSETAFSSHRKLKDSIDPNVILINPTSLLNTEIDNIHHEFKKLLNNLKEKLMGLPDDDDGDDEDLQGTDIFKLTAGV